MMERLEDLIISKENIDYALQFLFDSEEKKELKLSASFEVLRNLFLRILEHNQKDSIYIFIEYDYVERMYRDTYYTYFSGKNQFISRSCKRLFLFTKEVRFLLKEKCIDQLRAEDEFIGTITIRPLKGRELGRTLLNPKFLIDDSPNRIQLATYRANMRGLLLPIKAFPYSMQDGEMVTCAELTIQNIVDYYSARYSNYHTLLPSDIMRIAHEYGYQRNLPSHGLSYESVSKVFLESRFFPRLYRGGEYNVALKEILHCYIESGMVVAVGLRNSIKKGHSLICIGRGAVNPDAIVSKIFPVPDETYTEDCYVADISSGCSSYIVMDDARMPYSRCEIKTYGDVWDHRLKCYKNDTVLGYLSEGNKEEYSVECIVVPMSKRMYLEATDACEIIRNIVTNNEFGISAWIKKINKQISGIEDNSFGLLDIGTKDNPIVMRTFLTTTRSYKRNKREVFNDNIALRSLYTSAVMPKYIWVTELYTKESLRNHCVLGEVVIDATASARISNKMDAVLLIHYPWMFVRRESDDSSIGFENKIIDSSTGLENKIIENWGYFDWQPWEPFHFHTEKSESL